MSPPISRTKLFAALPHLLKLSTVVVLLPFFLPSLFVSLLFFLFFSVFLFFPLVTCTVNFSTLFLLMSSGLSTGRVPWTSVIQRTFWGSCGWIVGYLSDSDTKKVDDGGDPPDCIDLNKSEFPSFDASSNSSFEEEAEQEEETKEACEHEEEEGWSEDEIFAPVDKINEDEIINDEMLLDMCDLDALLGSEDDSSFHKLLLFWRRKERGLV